MQEWALTTTMKQHIQETIEDIAHALQSMKIALDHNDECILCKVEDIQKMLLHIQATTASYYVKTYLSPYTNCYIHLLTAIQHLSKKRHGALIAVEREQSLKPFIQSGIQLSAHLTVPLLESIFYPGNPLHDGAVLVKDNHIISAANILPLSQQASVTDRKLGTRHRAAIGLSEVSDALVLIVSEETGKTSFALAGTLYTFML
ncbi:sporulation-specific diadenylate cyclase CdaS [Bacillus sp. DX1.1]|uniref:sporulation-specific diadenylate cyclase CdaS n=1 Tax=unclassified Bacillus (in: firmicutes) TaxID=185979 RepID=UPI0025712D1F|nr:MULTISPECIES: sporulation-specific diadenylate cyclase CdaS [unclassified Bacillus (in: firmicutes)]MDM5157047.1 sporulation-specific diadenylate cyclase CdaS [Bacillus sp. DX1.1]WJE81284.1 sporulation-specific diadenylate cyclase CdaS [Bacillus sp. DX3.1]